jgi:type I restriction enzyme S subunit
VITHRERTILGDIPEDWDAVPLRTILSRSASGDWGDDRGEALVPVLRSTNFTADRRLDFTDVPLRGFPIADASRFDIRLGDILVERSGGGPAQPVGRVVVSDRHLSEYGFSNFVQLLRVDQEKMNPDYVAWSLHELHRRGFVERLQHQTTQMRNLDFRDYLRLRMPKPPRPEQDAIAHVITIADAAGRRFEEQLASAKRLRTSLLQTLFTAGMPGLHESYREVTVLRRVLRIPATWRFERLGTFLSKVDYGTNALANHYGGWPVVAIPQVIEPVLVRADWPFVEIPVAEAEQLRLEEGDVLLVRTNGNPEYIGKSTVVPATLAREHVVFASYLIRARARESDLLGRYLNLFLASPLGRRQLLAFANTSAGNHNLGSRSLKRMLIPLPPTEEQESIAARVAAVDRLNDSVRAKITAADAAKASLMRNLLTGRVRTGRVRLQVKAAV